MLTEYYFKLFSRSQECDVQVVTCFEAGTDFQSRFGIIFQEGFLNSSFGRPIIKDFPKVERAYFTISIACTVGSSVCDVKARTVPNSTPSFTVHSGSHLTPRNTEATPNQFKIRTTFPAKVLLPLSRNTCKENSYQTESCIMSYTKVHNVPNK